MGVIIPFSTDLTLKSNTHVEDMGRVIGIKMVDFYITDVGEANPNADHQGSAIAEHIDIVCPDIPKVAQLLDERRGLVLERIPLESHYRHSSSTIQTDRQWRSYPRQNKLLQSHIYQTTKLSKFLNREMITRITF